MFKGFYEILEAMGMASMSSSGESLKLCVFDLRRGQNEGQELDKILFFYPPDVTFSTQLSVIGLSEGLITFTRSASRDSLPFRCSLVCLTVDHVHLVYGI